MKAWDAVTQARAGAGGCLPRRTAVWVTCLDGAEPQVQVRRITRSLRAGIVALSGDSGIRISSRRTVTRSRGRAPAGPERDERLFRRTAMYICSVHPWNVVQDSYWEHDITPVLRTKRAASTMGDLGILRGGTGFRLQGGHGIRTHCPWRELCCREQRCGDAAAACWRRRRPWRYPYPKILESSRLLFRRRFFRVGTTRRPLVHSLGAVSRRRGRVW